MVITTGYLMISLDKKQRRLERFISVRLKMICWRDLILFSLLTLIQYVYLTTVLKIPFLSTQYDIFLLLQSMILKSLNYCLFIHIK